MSKKRTGAFAERRENKNQILNNIAEFQKIAGSSPKNNLKLHGFPHIILVRWVPMKRFRVTGTKERC